MKLKDDLEQFASSEVEIINAFISTFNYIIKDINNYQELPKPIKDSISEDLFNLITE